MENEWRLLSSVQGLGIRVWGMPTCWASWSRPMWHRYQQAGICWRSLGRFKNKPYSTGFSPIGPDLMETYPINVSGTVPLGPVSVPDAYLLGLRTSKLSLSLKTGRVRLLCPRRGRYVFCATNFVYDSIQAVEFLRCQGGVSM